MYHVYHMFHRYIIYYLFIIYLFIYSTGGKGKGEQGAGASSPPSPIMIPWIQPTGRTGYTCRPVKPEPFIGSSLPALSTEVQGI